MLVDYYDDLKTKLEEQRADLAKSLEADFGANETQTLRGMVRGFDGALEIAAEVMKRYSADALDDEGEGPTRSKITQVKERYPKHYGSRRRVA